MPGRIEYWKVNADENRACSTTRSVSWKSSSLLPGNPTIKGHAALHCDSPDHLPVVGALGDIAAMQTAYAKLALDKNYRLDNVPCPYLPNAYINTAHGTRGLATAPVCAAAIAADILSLPQPLSQRLRTETICL